MKITAGIKSAATMFVLFTMFLCPAAPITRIDIYDKSDNHLLFVTFDYDAAGKNIGRSVFASDSTFLRSTTFGTSGTAAKETSIDFNSNPIFVTTINAPIAGKTAFSTVDQFGLSQFGPPLTWQETSANNYDITQNGILSCKEQYEFGTNGDLNKINIQDKNGALAWYALVSHETSGISQIPGLTSLQLSRIVANRAEIRIRVNLISAGEVRAQLFTPAGRRVAVLVDNKMAAGLHSFTVNGSRFGRGAYVVRMTIDGLPAMSGRVFLQKQ